MKLRFPNGFKATAVTLIVFCLLVQLTALALRIGYTHAQGLADSRGRPVGFNEPLTAEHFGLLISRATVSDTLSRIDLAEAAILMAHGLALILLFSRRTRGFLVAVFTLTQVIALFWGAQGMLMLLAHSSGPAWTGESIVEGPLSSIAASGIWFVVSCLLLRRR